MAEAARGTFGRSNFDPNREYVLSGAYLNSIEERLARCEKITGDGHIMVSRGSGGTVIRARPQNVGFFPVKVQMTGGSNGSASTKASYTYTARTMQWNGTSGGAELGTALAPVKKREVGLLEVPTGSTTVGVGYYDEAGEFQLWDANEEFDTGSCA